MGPPTAAALTAAPPGAGRGAGWGPPGGSCALPCARRLTTAMPAGRRYVLLMADALLNPANDAASGADFFSYAGVVRLLATKAAVLPAW